ncbi:phosphotransferase [Enterococcus sp. AZ109]|uniref:phosphotransferase n=1 Tax=Enterococcus sp. AZ109 TaxID=2774634 RepID=UPI003F29995D
MGISTETLKSYLLEKTELFDSREPLEITHLTNDEDHYVEGYVNYIYRIRQGKKSYIVKHAKEFIPSGIDLGRLDPGRNYLEFMTYTLRAGFTKDSVPDIYFVDQENHLFIMEDISNMEVLRFFLCHGKKAWILGEKIGIFLARSHFLTSSFHLNQQKMASLALYFENEEMRKVIVDFILQPHEETRNDLDDYEIALYRILKELTEKDLIWDDWLYLIDNFVKKRQCLIHGDFHSSNIFISSQQMKAIDMEYTMIGPFSYDLGYFLANLLSQFACFSVNPDFSKAERLSMTEYLLKMFADVYSSYFDTFTELYTYQTTKETLQTDLFLSILQESLGYMAMANITRTANSGPFPDFDNITSKKMRFVAKALSLKLSENIFIQRAQICTVEDFLTLIVNVRNSFLSDLTDESFSYVMVNS